MKQIDRLLLFQGNRCFFCDETIPEGEASIEHLVHSSNGGSNDDDNCVVCCKTLNSAFGNRPYKEKLRAIVSHRGNFICPRGQISAIETHLNLTAPSENSKSKLAVVIADLRKRGPSRPRKVETLKNTIGSVFQKQLTQDEVTAIYSNLLASGYITVNQTNVSYSLPVSDRADR